MYAKESNDKVNGEGDGSGKGLEVKEDIFKPKDLTTSIKSMA